MALTTPALQTSLGADVLAFATEQGVNDLLLPVLDMTRRLFPDARRLEVMLEDDPELADDRHIVFEVEIGPTEVFRSADLHWQWSRNLFQLCPAKHTCLFGLHVNMSKA